MEGILKEACVVRDSSDVAFPWYIFAEERREANKDRHKVAKRRGRAPVATAVALQKGTDKIERVCIDRHRQIVTNEMVHRRENQNPAPRPLVFGHATGRTPKANM